MDTASYKRKIISELGFNENKLNRLFEKCDADTEAKQINFLTDLKSLREYKPDNDFFVKACLENLLYDYGLSVEMISKLAGIEEKNILIVLNGNSALTVEEKYNLTCSLFRFCNLILNAYKK